MNAWIKTEDQMPENGQEVTALMDHGQIRQIVRDTHYSGGWKQVNCQGWECVSFDPRTITHWRPEVFERPTMRGPKDAPWMLYANTERKSA